MTPSNDQGPVGIHFWEVFMRAFLLVVGLTLLALFPLACAQNQTAPAPVTNIYYLNPTPTPWGISGQDWDFAALSAAFSGRIYFSSLVFNGRMWVIGGSGSSGNRSDIYYSVDGTNWQLA